MENHALSMISWFKRLQPCENGVYKLLDFLETATLLDLSHLLQMFILACCALEKISLFSIMLIRGGRRPQGVEITTG